MLNWQEFMRALILMLPLAYMNGDASAQEFNDSSGREYMIREGETLRQVSQKFYEDPLAFPTIVEATNSRHNDGLGFLKIENEFDVRAGQIVWVPIQATHRMEPAENGHGSIKPVAWGYQGDGNPALWGELLKGYAACGRGKRQSPINLSTDIAVTSDRPKFDYKSSRLEVTNNGRTIQVNYEPGSTLTFKGQKYELNQFHFHVPSEHTFDGVLSSMEAHFVHVSTDGKVLVLGVLYETGADYADTLAEIWDILPPAGYILETNHQINVRRLFNAESPMFHYGGSLTTPPCTENVEWLIILEKEQVTRRQLSRLVELNGFNARPTQAQTEVSATQR